MERLTPLQRRLLKRALISSPLIGAISVIPIIGIRSALPNIVQGLPPVDVVNVLMGYSVITSLSLALWIYNIFLIHWLGKDKNQRNILRYIISLTGGAAFFFLLALFVFPLPARPLFSIPLPPIFASLTITFVILVLCGQVRDQYENERLQLQVAQLEIARLVAEQKQLKQQFQPHFLFNALSNLSILIEDDPPAALTYTRNLSAFLRYSLRYARQNTATVGEELGFLEQYMALQRVRFGEALQVHIDVPPHVRDRKLLPVFSLQLLAENAIKHNAPTLSDPLKINIAASGDSQLTLANNKQKRFQAAESTGIGLGNLVERHKMVTGESPRIDNLDNSFSVTLKLKTT